MGWPDFVPQGLGRLEPGGPVTWGRLLQSWSLSAGTLAGTPPGALNMTPASAPGGQQRPVQPGSPSMAKTLEWNGVISTMVTRSPDSRRGDRDPHPSTEGCQSNAGEEPGAGRDLSLEKSIRLLSGCRQGPELRAATHRPCRQTPRTVLLRQAALLPWSPGYSGSCFSDYCDPWGEGCTPHTPT